MLLAVAGEKDPSKSHLHIPSFANHRPEYAGEEQLGRKSVTFRFPEFTSKMISSVSTVHSSALQDKRSLLVFSRYVAEGFHLSLFAFHAYLGSVS